jgi:hypothetical protein
MLKNTFPSLDMNIVMISLSGACFSDTEEGVSIGAASWGRKDVVNMKKVNSKENKSTIGVMSMCGDLAGCLIFGMGFSF